MAFFVLKKDKFGFGKPIAEPQNSSSIWECSTRDAETFRKMYERIKKWNVKFILATDTAFIVILYHKNV